MKKDYLEPEFEYLKFNITNDLMLVSAETVDRDLYADGDDFDDWG